MLIRKLNHHSNCARKQNNHSHFKTKQRPQRWQKLPTLIASITHCQNTKKTLLLYVIKINPIISNQHGFKHIHSTQTSLHNLFHQITKGFNNPRPPQRTVAVALDISKAFDTVNKHKHKCTQTHTKIHSNIIIQFIANYIKNDKHALNTSHSQNSNESTPEYHKVEFCLQLYSTFTPLAFHSSQKTYISQHMLMT